MASHTSLLFGFPLLSKHSFTTVVQGGSYCVDGTQEDWMDAFARSQGITVVPKPDTSDMEYEVFAALTDEEQEQMEAPRRAYEAQVAEVLSGFGACCLHAAGDQDYAPDFFVCALAPKLERVNEPRQYAPFRPVPDLAVEPAVLEQLRRFCAAMGIEYREPKWYLVDSYYMD